MTNDTRYQCARASYWLLFVAIPVLLTGLLSGETGFAIGAFVVCILVGEHVFRPWKRLWKVED